jgi:hypothetical protein
LFCRIGLHTSNPVDTWLTEKFWHIRLVIKRMIMLLKMTFSWMTSSMSITYYITSKMSICCVYLCIYTYVFYDTLELIKPINFPSPWQNIVGTGAHLSKRDWNHDPRLKKRFAGVGMEVACLVFDIGDIIPGKSDQDDCTGYGNLVDRNASKSYQPTAFCWGSDCIALKWRIQDMSNNCLFEIECHSLNQRSWSFLLVNE